jgi:hypothetical protein
MSPDGDVGAFLIYIHIKYSYVKSELVLGIYLHV